MTDLRSRQAHTLAQLARRAGISEGRARALYAAKPMGLPRPDRTDADGRPLWWASTIDAWCAHTGREVNAEALWLFRAPPATAPAAELQRGPVKLGRWAFYVIVWDTEYGHLIYLEPLGDTGGAHKDWLAVHAAEVIEPRWWADAVVVMPIEEGLVYFPTITHPPMAYVYRLTARRDTRDGIGDGTGNEVGHGAGEVGDAGRMFDGLRRWLSRSVLDPVDPVGFPAPPQASWEGQMDLAEIATVVGRPVPVWLEGTTTWDNAEQTLSYDRTFTVPDTATKWPAAEERLLRAIEVGLPGDFPAAFAALAVDATEGLTEITAAHERTADSGLGWYLVCRPARPKPSIELEQRITGARLVTDLGLVGKELAELRAVEGELDIDDPRGDVYAEAITLLEWQLRRAAKETGTIGSFSRGYVPVADDGFLPYSAPWAGPVVDAWRKTLTPIEDLGQDLAEVLRLRRVRRVLRDYPLDSVRAAYRDNQGRYVLVIHRNRDDWSVAEWPASLHATAHWTDKTILAGDDEHGTVTTLLALTPTDDGRMRIDPVPLPPRSDRDAFAYGYGGGTPGTTYYALLRCALGDELPSRIDGRVQRGTDSAPISQLWTAISTTKGPLRLSWPQVQLWARADRKTATTPSADTPPS